MQRIVPLSSLRKRRLFIFYRPRPSEGEGRPPLLFSPRESSTIFPSPLKKKVVPATQGNLYLEDLARFHEQNLANTKRTQRNSSWDPVDCLLCPRKTGLKHAESSLTSSLPTLANLGNEGKESFSVEYIHILE